MSATVAVSRNLIDIKQKSTADLNPFRAIRTLLDGGFPCDRNTWRRRHPIPVRKSVPFRAMFALNDIRQILAE